MIANVKSTIARLLPKNAFARGVSVLVGGTAGAQGLTILAAPLLTRLYTPEDFGLVAVYGGLLSLIGVVSSLRYELAIPLPEDDQEAAYVVALSLLIVLGTTIVSAVLVLFFRISIANALGVPRLADYFWLLPVGVLLSGAYTVFNYWSIRTKRFSTIAGTRLRQALATIAIQLSAFKAGGVALLFAQVVGQSVGAMALGKPALARPEFKAISWRGIKQAARRYRRFPMITTWAGLLNTGGSQLPPLMFASLFSAGAAGLYALAHRVMALPASLVGSAVSNVFFSNAAEAHRSHKLGMMVTDVHDKLAQIAMPPTLILVIAGPDLFVFIFGEHWRQAGEFARWMAPWLFLQFCTAPLTIVFAAVEKQHIGLMMQMQLFATRVVMILLGAISGDLQTTIILFSLGSAGAYLMFLVMILQTVGVPKRTPLITFGKAMLISALCVIPLLFVISSPNMGAELIPFACMTLILVGLRYAALYKYGV